MLKLGFGFAFVLAQLTAPGNNLPQILSANFKSAAPIKAGVRANVNVTFSVLKGYAVNHTPPISLKLKAPFMAYVVEDWKELSQITAQGFEPVMSFAQGGFANAWGAGVYRFTAKDLQEFPIRCAELDPYYAELTRHIGISGTSDDLDAYFGSAEGLLEPLHISRLARTSEAPGNCAAAAAVAAGSVPAFFLQLATTPTDKPRTISVTYEVNLLKAFTRFAS